jgi:hypothetical protein
VTAPDIPGGLDKRAMADTLADVDREPDKARRMVKRERYVAGFDHLILPDTERENLHHAATRLKEICYRP